MYWDRGLTGLGEGGAGASGGGGCDFEYAWKLPLSS